MVLVWMWPRRRPMNPLAELLPSLQAQKQLGLGLKADGVLPLWG